MDGQNTGECGRGEAALDLRAPSGALRRAVFLDRDGTLNVERNYLKDPEQLVLIPGVPAALRRLRDAGFLLLIVTNQSGIGRGYYTEADMHAVNRRLVELLAMEGVRFEHIYFAPEAPEQPSRGRKPSPQFLWDARDAYRIDLSRSYLVGDKLADLECGWNAGVRASVLVRTGYGRETELRRPEAVGRAVVVDDLAGAAEAICKDLEEGSGGGWRGTPELRAGAGMAENSRVSKVVGMVPARYASTRFPGKPLHLIAGKPLIQHVVERCREAASLSDVVVATDDDRIAAVASRFAKVEMTRSEHPSGTDRIAEVAARLDCEAVINIQGDEPLMDPKVIDAVAAALAQTEMSTAAAALRDLREYENPNVVKVVTSLAGRALYFSRRTIPYLRDEASKPTAEQIRAYPFLKHLGIYGYRRETLLRLVRYPVSALELAERLEQLRALENGIPIAVVRVEYESIGVDTPEDAVRVESILRGAG